MTNCITFFCEIENGLEAKKLDEESREMRGTNCELHYLWEYILTSEDARLTLGKHCRIT